MSTKRVLHVSNTDMMDQGKCPCYLARSIKTESRPLVHPLTRVKDYRCESRGELNHKSRALENFWMCSTSYIFVSRKSNVFEIESQVETSTRGMDHYKATKKSGLVVKLDLAKALESYQRNTLFCFITYH